MQPSENLTTDTPARLAVQLVDALRLIVTIKREYAAKDYLLSVSLDMIAERDHKLKNRDRRIESLIAENRRLRERPKAAA